MTMSMILGLVVVGLYGAVFCESTARRRNRVRPGRRPGPARIGGLLRLGGTLRRV